MQKKSKHNVKAGDVFGRLTLTGVTIKKDCSDGRRTMHEAKCECGDIRLYLLKYLLRGDTKSCGCYKRDAMAKALTTHNLSNHPLYSVYQDMVRRCYEPACKAYEDYGGRGITVCQEWLDDIFAFRSWAMLNGYDTGLQLDRENNDGNYEPSNCRFVTKDINNINTRRNVYLEAWGERKTVTEWSRDKRCKVNWNTLKGRLKRGNWDLIQAMTTVGHGRTKEIARENLGRKIMAWGEEKSIIDWSEDERCKIGYSGLKIRLKKGWTSEGAISTEPQH